MKIVGILVLGLVSGVIAATVSLVSGGSLWAALLNYLAVGMATTLLGVTAIIWRAWEAERPNEIMLNGATSASK